MSFSCPHCGNENSEVQPGAPIQDHGVQYTLLIKRKEVRTCKGIIYIPTKM